MEIAQILDLYTQQERIQVEFPGMRKDVLANLVRFVRPAPGMSTILYSQLDESNADQVIAEQAAYFREANQSVSWKVCIYDMPHDLGSRLAAQGFEGYGDQSVMVLELQDAPPALLEAPRVDVRALTTCESLEDVIRVEEQVWGGKFDWIRKRLGDNLDVPGYINIFAAYVDNEPACAAWIYFTPGGEFASLWGGSTVEKYRHQGLYTALLAARVQAARQRGYRFLTIDAGSMSRPIVERHGFRLLTYAQDFELEAKML